MTSPLKHAHISQLHSDGSGWNDCLPASLARYLYESGKVPIDRDPFSVINEIDMVMRQQSDSPNNPDTTLLQAETALRHYGLPVNYSTSYQDAYASPWAICLVDGRQLRPAQYDASWFGPAPGANHFILWLPASVGADNWFNDPLAYANGQADCQYDLASVAAAWVGAYLLPAIATPQPAPAPKPVPVPVPQPKTLDGETTVACGLKPDPSHGGTDIAQVPADATIAILPWQVKDKTTGELWQRIRWRDTEGWVLNSNVRALAPVPHG